MSNTIETSIDKVNEVSHCPKVNNCGEIDSCGPEELSSRLENLKIPTPKDPAAFLSRKDARHKNYLQSKALLLELNPEARREVQVERFLEKTLRGLAKEGFCTGCSLFPRYCICEKVQVFEGEPSRVSVNVIVGAEEFYRASSTSKVIAKTIPGSKSFIPCSPKDGDINRIWASIRKEADSRGQVACVLFPSSKSQPLRSFLKTLSPEQRRAGISITAIDGTWRQAKSYVRSLPDDVPHVMVENPYLFTLFGPLRTQPEVGRVSTLEAVACVFQDVCSSDCTGPEGGSFCSVLGREIDYTGCERRIFFSEESVDVSANSKTSNPARFVMGPELLPRFRDVPFCHRPLLDNSNELLDGTGTSAGSVAVDVFEDVVRPPMTHVCAALLRKNLCLLVDSLMRQGGQLSHMGRGTGYGSWTMQQGPTNGLFARLPVRLLRKIAVFAYGEENVRQLGYGRRAAFTENTLALQGASEEALEAVRNRHPGPECAKFFRKCSSGGLPLLDAYNSFPLALVNSYFYYWASGYWKVQSDSLEEEKLSPPETI